MTKAKKSTNGIEIMLQQYLTINITAQTGDHWQEAKYIGRHSFIGFPTIRISKSLKSATHFTNSLRKRLRK
jgi:hypothetical protein